MALIGGLPIGLIALIGTILLGIAIGVAIPLLLSKLNSKINKDEDNSNVSDNANSEKKFDYFNQD